MSDVSWTCAVVRNLVPWRPMAPEAVTIWGRSALSLRDAWNAVAREKPERRYERRILKRMARGALTNTLGVQIRDEPLVRQMAERWLGILIQLGLRPDDLCVEFGCGSLWCAEPVIRRQQPGRFIGLDATDSFYELGRQRLDALLTEKEVGLGVISRRTLREVAALRPALVYSHRVIHHVPRHALRRYMRNLVALLNDRTILVIENTRPLPGEAQDGRRYVAEDIRPHLPQGWQCRQEPFGLLITRSRT